MSYHIPFASSEAYKDFPRTSSKYIGTKDLIEQNFNIDGGFTTDLTIRVRSNDLIYSIPRPFDILQSIFIKVINNRESNVSTFHSLFNSITFAGNSVILWEITSHTLDMLYNMMPESKKRAYEKAVKNGFLLLPDNNLPVMCCPYTQLNLMINTKENIEVFARGKILDDRSEVRNKLIGMKSSFSYINYQTCIFPIQSLQFNCRLQSSFSKNLINKIMFFVKRKNRQIPKIIKRSSLTYDDTSQPRFDLFSEFTTIINPYFEQCYDTNETTHLFSFGTDQFSICENRYNDMKLNITLESNIIGNDRLEQLIFCGVKSGTSLFKNSLFDLSLLVEIKNFGLNIVNFDSKTPEYHLIVVLLCRTVINISNGTMGIIN